ncbi:C4-dicarboxylate TRAP transporter substrate-binding protein [Hoeflea sp.]|jgi:TRAP-type C4-dicarboxylate transport system substrate-binding protein|uniref:C4-dicarboxylate TRAP transporter substrate-binding protein n=1 Tax=Hoeflea sp. TaxID=1940281 RepID=UPI000C0FA3CE|nr:C4-dicarboxylate TRAP transporter substrate-binding protein [Hoeflea sp.]MBC7280570.1 C4-dicarboxylate TRAP transporter substrate-binding protein [Hoeflea sp.]PHR17185.1 MAG: C4-dicarboxylate ABC transporter substrate-binding protein [Hoeflea sp.]
MKFKMRIAVALGLLASTSVATAETRLTASMWASPTHILTIDNYINFTKSVEEASGGDLVFDLYIGGSLLPANGTLSGVRDGVADVGSIIGAYTPADLPLSNVLNDASLIVSDTMAAAFALAELSFNNEHLQGEWNGNGVIYGGAYSTPPYIFACVPTVHEVADLKGLKVRTAAGSHVEFMKFTGAVPVSVPITEVYTGLERGSIDCVMTDATNLSTGYKLWEVAKTITLLPMGTHTSGAAWAYNQNSWRSLTPAQRRRLLDQMALAMVRCQLDYDGQEATAYEGSWERNLAKVEPGESLKKAFADFKTSYIANLAASSAKGRGVSAATAQSLIDNFEAGYKRWEGLLSNVDRKDEAALVELLKSEVYNKVDENAYGL